MDRSVINSPVGKIVGGTLFVVLLATWALWPRRMPAPRESDRVWHPDGYSMISPAGWTASIETAQRTKSRYNRGWLRFEPRTSGYYQPSLTVQVLSSAPDAANLKSEKQFKDGSFHGLPAFVAATQQSKYWAHEIIFQDRDRWFQITLSIPGYEDVPNSSWWPFIDSFVYDPTKAIKQTSPATKPDVDLTFTTTFPSTAPAPEPAAPVH